MTNRHSSLVDAFYMTFITIATIGFSEIINLSGNPMGRLFTVFIAASGIGVLAYVATNLTAFFVEGELTESFRRRKMESMAKHSKEHYVVCGFGSVGQHIVNELRTTRIPHVVIDASKKDVTQTQGLPQDEIFLEGDATDNSTLLRAGITEARGLFAVTDDDNLNLVICLTARQLNPNLRIVARCNEIKNSEKMTRAGANAVVSPGFIGGLRMASEMIRPTVVSFLDRMLRDSDQNLRVEEAQLPARFVGKALTTLNLKKHRRTLLLAIKTGDDWIYNPADDYVVATGDTLIVMTTPEGRSELNAFLQADKS